jgi:hypothetical protein
MNISMPTSADGPHAAVAAKSRGPAFAAALFAGLLSAPAIAGNCDAWREYSCYRTYEYCTADGGPDRDCMMELIDCLTAAGCVAP